MEGRSIRFYWPYLIIWFNILEKGANILGNKGKLVEILIAIKYITTLQP